MKCSKRVKKKIALLYNPIQGEKEMEILEYELPLVFLKHPETIIPIVVSVKDIEKIIKE